MNLYIIIKKYSNELRQSEFIKNVITLISGSTLSQLIPFLVAPIISRLYFPEDYAVLAAYNSITVLFTIVATGMYSSALMIDKTDEEAFSTGIAAFIVTIAITILSLIVFLIFTDRIAKLTGNENVTFWLYFIPLMVFFTGGYQTLNMWNNRKKRYKRLASNRVVQTIITSGLTLLLGLLSYHSTGLLISMLLGQVFSFVLLFVQTMKNDNHFIPKLNLTYIKNSFVVHKDFPKYNMPQGFLDGFRESSVIVIISNFFGANVLGSFSFAMNMVNKPFQFIGNAFNQVYYQKASEIYSRGQKIESFTKKIILVLSIFSAPILILFLIGGKELFSLVFGERWKEAGIYAQFLVTWIVLRFILSSISTIPFVLNELPKNFIYSVLYNIFPPIILLITSNYINSFINTLLLFTLSNVFVIVLTFVWFSNLFKKGIQYESRNTSWRAWFTS